METLKNVNHANLNDNDISNVGGPYNRNTTNVSSTSTTVYGNSESSTLKFLDLIPPIDCQTKHNHVKSSIRTHPTAGEWLLRSETYNTWKSGNSSTRLLWLHGIPGVGKTVICSRVIDDLRNKQDHPVVFFYCHDTSARYDSRSILASLLRQLLKYTPPDFSKFSRILKDYNEIKLVDDYDFMLTELLREISFLHEKTFIVIDALNECSNLEAMLREFVILAKELCIFISSRDHAAIRMKFKCYEQIRIHEDNIAEDILRYVTEEVTSVKIQSNKLRNSVTDKLVKGAQGSFLWPVYKAQQLRGAETDREMEYILTTIPQGMQSAIVKSLKTIDSKKNSELLRSALQLVVCSLRPITLRALSEVMGAIETKDTWNPDLITRDPQDLVDDFAGLLLCVSGKERIRYGSCWSKGFSFDRFGDDDIVVPFHLCVKEYLLADPVMLPSDLQKYSFYPLKANDDSITKICLEYRNLVLKHALNLDLDPAHYPFADYARERLLPLGENTGDSQKHGIVVSKKNFAIVFLIILMGYIFALMRPTGVPSFLLQDHEQADLEWQKTVSCRVLSERPRWFGLFGEPVPIIDCTASSVMDSQIQSKFIAFAEEVGRKIRTEKEDITTEAVQQTQTYWNLLPSPSDTMVEVAETCNSLPSPADIVEEAKTRNPLASPSDIVEEKTDNEIRNTTKIESEFTNEFSYWVTHSGSELAHEIASKLGTTRESIRIETSKQLVTSLKPPPPPSDTVSGYNTWLDKPRPATIEEYLRNFEVVFVVDDSKSMGKGKRWTETRDALATIAQKAYELKVNTASLRFLNDASYGELKGRNKLMSLFDAVKPRGWTPLGRALNAVFKGHLNRIDTAVGKGKEEYSKIPPLDIIVLTDGVPTDRGEDTLRKVIANAVKWLNDNYYHPNTMSVQIVQIANEHKAKQVFRDLVVGDNGRIVDTVPYAGIVDSEKLLRILLGGVHPNIRSQLPIAMLAIEQPELE